MKRTVLVFVLLVAVLTPAMVFAADTTGGYIQLPPCTACGRCGFDDFLQLFINLYHFGLELIGPLAVLFFIIGGTIMLTAGGYESRYKLGRDILSQVVAGVIIAILSWVIVDTTIFIITGNPGRTVFGRPWYQGFTYTTSEIACPGRSTTGTATPPPPTATGSCQNLPVLAADNHVPYPAKNSTALNLLKDCILTRVTSGIDQTQVYTWGGQETTDMPYPDYRYYSLNFNFGHRDCESCPSGACHGVGSCHYAPRGSDGSMAVDFNASSGDEQTLCRQLYTLVVPADGACHGLAGTFRFEDTHTHITAGGCNDTQQIDCDGNLF